MSESINNPYELPRLRVSFGFENDAKVLKNDESVAEFFDVKFCPFQPLDCDPVFAAISKKHIVICKLWKRSGDANPCEIINVIRDDDEGASGCCSCWVEDPTTGAPLICVGGVDAKVKIYNALDGRLINCLVGHGGDVNDLETSPLDSSIIASASDDTSVRIWSIDTIHSQQPCLCILAGEGHSWNLLTLDHCLLHNQAYHDTGRYLLSAGHDQVINLWFIPDLPTEPVSTPLQVHYPLFSTSAVHSGIVDCVAFFGDQILSRACHDNVLVLWRIEGFSGDAPPPPQSMAPMPQNVVPTSKEDPGKLTRSAFVPSTSPLCPAQYTRLLEFHTPHCGPQFFIRFKLHHVLGQHPILAFCNAAGNIFFWDFERLTAYHDLTTSIRDPSEDRAEAIQLPDWIKPISNKQRSNALGRLRIPGSDRDSLASSHTGLSATSSDYCSDTIESVASKYSLKDPQEPLRAHKTESSSANFVGRQVAWSPGGEWCVVVGSSNTTLILQRWTKRDFQHRRPSLAV